VKLSRAPILQPQDPNADPEGATYILTSRGHWYSADKRWLFIGRRGYWLVIASIGDDGDIDGWQSRHKACKSVGLDKAEFRSRRQAIGAVEALFPAEQVNA
jgi:hypothetical protein